MELPFFEGPESQNLLLIVPCIRLIPTVDLLLGLGATTRARPGLRPNLRAPVFHPAAVPTPSAIGRQMKLGVASLGPITAGGLRPDATSPAKPGAAATNVATP